MAYYLFSLSPLLLLRLGLSFCLSVGKMAAAQIGKSCGRFGKRLFPPLTFSLLSLCVVINWRGHIQDEKQVSQEKCESLYAFSWYQHQLPRSPLLPPLFSLCLLSTSAAFPSLHCLSGSVALLSLFPCFLRAAPSLQAALSLCSLFTLGLPECMFVSVCRSINKRDRARERERVCASERERERVREGGWGWGLSEFVLTHAGVCVCACRGACWQSEVGGGTDRRKEGGREKREIEERSDEERVAEHIEPPHSPTFLWKSSQTTAIGERND